MLLNQSKKLTLSFLLCTLLALLLPKLALAEAPMVLAATDTGKVAANQAADQRAALAKKAEERRLAAEKLKSSSSEAPKTEKESKEQATDK